MSRRTGIGATDGHSRARAGSASGDTNPLVRFLARSFISVRNRHLLLWDILAQPMVILGAFSLRLEQFNPPAWRDQMWAYGLLSALLVPAVFSVFGIYRRFWRYAGSAEAELLVTASILGALVTAVPIYFILVPAGVVGSVPRSIPFISAMLTIALTALPRYAIRVAVRVHSLASKPQLTEDPVPVLIAGAGEAGHAVIKELQANPQTGYVPVGVVDDDPTKHGLRMLGCSVLGPTDDIPRLARAHHAERLIIAMPSAGGAVIRRIANRAAEAGLAVLTLPGVYELISGEVKVSRLRSISVEDLLRRDPVHIDREQVEGLLRGRRVLVTGGGGSIGSELCRQVASCNPAQLIILGHGENSIYQIGHEIEQSYPRLGKTLQIADIRDRSRLDQVFRTHRPEFVLHAAAHKHVPLMETNIPDAITNNVQGTANVVEAATTYDVGHLVMISSDKAVNPTSVMGVTKRLAEMIVQDAALRGNRGYVVVRFGNVLGSRGSVVPLFERQIADGGPITITHPDVRRYFMTIPEAVQLVLQAATFGKGGEIFVLDMGEPIRIYDLAEDMIRLSGLRPQIDVEIRTVGLRPGEKLFEELNVRNERHMPSPHEKIYVLRTDARLSISDDSERLHSALASLNEAAVRGESSEAKRIFKELVPEYVPQS